MVFRCALSRVVPRLLSTTRALVASRHPLLSVEKNSSVFRLYCGDSREIFEMADSSKSVEGKMKELNVGGSKQKQSSKSVEVTADIQCTTSSRCLAVTFLIMEPSPCNSLPSTMQFFCSNNGKFYNAAHVFTHLHLHTAGPTPSIHSVSY